MSPQAIDLLWFLCSQASLIKVHFYVENSNREDSESLTLFPCMFKVRIHEMRCRNTG